MCAFGSCYTHTEKTYRYTRQLLEVLLLHKLLSTMESLHYLS